MKLSIRPRNSSDPYTYQQLYFDVVQSREYDSNYEKVLQLARRIYRYGYEGQSNLSKDDCVVYGIELFELMTGIYWDPTLEEFEELKANL